MSQAVINATKEWLEHVMPNPWPFKRGKVLRVPTNSVTLAGLEAAFVWEATDRNRAILFLNIFGFHAKLNMGINQVSPTLVSYRLILSQAIGELHEKSEREAT